MIVTATLSLDPLAAAVLAVGLLLSACVWAGVWTLCAAAARADARLDAARKEARP